MDSQPAVIFQNGHYTHPGTDFTLHIPDLSIAPHSTNVITGPSGSGKTTLIHLIAGILLPQRGQLLVHGFEPMRSSESQRRRFRLEHIGFVFQRFELIDHLNVRDNILITQRLLGTSTRTPELHNRLHQLATDCGIADKLERPIRKLSQGEQQRIAICRALLHQPALLIADEPTGNLDPTTTQAMLDLMLRHARTLLFVTHDTNLVPHFDHHLHVNNRTVGAPTTP